MVTSMEDTASQTDTFLALNHALPFRALSSLALSPASLYGQNSKPIISNRDADWDCLVVEERQLPSFGEIVLPARRHHAVACQLGGSSRIARTCRGRSDERIFAPSDFSLCPAGEPATVRWQEETHILQVLLPARWVAETALMMGVRETAEPLQVSFGTASPQVVYTALALQAEMKSGCPGGPLCAETLASALTVSLLQYAGAKPLPAQKQSSGLGRSDLACVLTYIGDHLAENLSLRELAGCTPLSLYHFSRLFKQSTGLPPHEYILQQRVEKAKTLLAARRLTVGEVAQAVGFFDHSSLCRHFKRLTGFSPRQFQRR